MNQSLFSIILLTSYLLILAPATVPATVQAQGSPFMEIQKLLASDAAIDDFFGESIAISGETIIVGAEGDDHSGLVAAGSAYIFERNQNGPNNWGEVVQLTASDAASFDDFGISVSISDDTIVVGAFGNDDAGGASGSAYIFERDEGGANNWGEVAKLTASDAVAEDFFGKFVAISGATIVVGAYGNDDHGVDSGSAYIFERDHGGANNWGEVAKLTASDAATGDLFGYSVSVSGDFVVVGARQDDTVADNSGSAYIFERHQGGTNNWGEVVKLTASDKAKDDFLGESVAIQGETIIVGAEGDDHSGFDDAGSAYIFERHQGGANNWGEMAKLKASDADSFDDFGISVSISGDTIIVGAFGNDDAGGASGSAYIFARDQGGTDNWGEVAKHTASDAAAGDKFGNSVSISGDILVVGAYQDDTASDNSGSAYVFQATADSSISKTDSADPVVAGGQFEYLITVQNFGPGDANNVVVTDALPAGLTLVSTNGCAEDPIGAPTCNLGAITSGTFKDFTLTVVVDPYFTDGIIINQASLTMSTPEANPGDESASEQTEVKLPALVVNSTADTRDSNLGDQICDDGSGACTLRAAIEQANVKVGLDQITFDIPLSDPGFDLATGTFTTRPLSELPVLSDPVIVDATTQSGFIGSPLIVIDGLLAGATAEGLVVTAGGSTVRGLVIHRFGLDGIRLSQTGGNVLEGNYIGTDASGSQDFGNGRIGILIRSPGNRIGGTTPAVRNIVSGNNNSGITYDGINTSGNLLQGNYIGTDATGAFAIGNGDPSIPNLDQNRAVHLNNRASGIIIGGTSAGAGNVISGNAGHGIFVNSGDDNAFQGNLIGTDASGNSPLGNRLVGVVVTQGSNNQVGGAGATARNVISANARGVAVSGALGSGNRVQGNYIGTDVTGTVAFGRQISGVNSDSPSTLIGGTALGEGNVISGNLGQAVLISNASATGVRVVGNFIGTASDGATPLGNGSHGVLIQLSANGNTVGEPVPGGNNLIAFNGGTGVAVVSGATGNTINTNEIFANTGLGIDLAPFGVSTNDPLDSDAGANDLQNFPSISAVLSGNASTTVEGFLESTPESIFAIDLFGSSQCDPAGQGEGESYLGTSEVTTNTLGRADFTIQLPTALNLGDFVTATATSPSGGTSEFSTCIPMTAP